MKREIVYASLIIAIMIAISSLLVLVSWFFTGDLSSSGRGNKEIPLLADTMEDLISSLMRDTYRMFMMITKPTFVLLIMCYYSNFASGTLCLMFVQAYRLLCFCHSRICICKCLFLHDNVTYFGTI